MLLYLYYIKLDVRIIQYLRLLKLNKMVFVI